MRECSIFRYLSNQVAADFCTYRICAKPSFKGVPVSSGARSLNFSLSLRLLYESSERSGKPSNYGHAQTRLSLPCADPDNSVRWVLFSSSFLVINVINREP